MAGFSKHGLTNIRYGFANDAARSRGNLQRLAIGHGPCFMTGPSTSVSLPQVVERAH
jgi:hypothetical protein